MTTDTIATLCRWLGTSEAELIRIAYARRYGWEVGEPTPDVYNAYAEGEIPRFLRTYILKVIYPKFIVN